jgi:hypothetical protein
MILSEDTFLLYAAKYYDNPQCSSYEEFEEDLKRFQYLKRLFNRYDNTGELKERLILNHIIVLYNCFGKNTTNMLFMKLEESQATLKPFVIQLNFMPEFIEYNNKRILSSDIPMDPIVVQTLRGI